MLVKNVAKEFLRFCKIERQLSQHTLAAYESDLTDLGYSLPRSIVVTEISVEDLKEYLQQMVERRQLSPATVRRRLAYLRAFYKYVSASVQIANPFLEWRPLVPRRKRLPRTLSGTETSSLLSLHSKPKRTYPATFLAAIRVMISTGIRVSELCSIQLECQDSNRRIPFLKKAFEISR